jgi:ATP-dependent Clp protease ATP-binding subunit ClpA
VRKKLKYPKYFHVENNPIIIGEPGVGKSAIVEGLAQLILMVMHRQHLLVKEFLP